MLITRIINDPGKPPTPVQVHAITIAAAVNGNQELQTDEERWQKFSNMVEKIKFFTKKQPGEIVKIDSTFPRYSIEHTENGLRSLAVITNF